MNSACLIAACAAASRRASEQQKNSYAQYFTKDFDLYYRVIFRKYFYFEEMLLVTPIESPCYLGSVYAPIKFDAAIKPVKVPAKTLAVAYSFPVRASKCKNGIDNYVKENLELFTSSSVWHFSEQQAIEKYTEELRKELNIEVEPESFRYTTQYCWEIELENRGDKDD